MTLVILGETAFSEGPVVAEVCSQGSDSTQLLMQGHMEVCG